MSATLAPPPPLPLHDTTSLHRARVTHRRFERVRNLDLWIAILAALVPSVVIAMGIGRYPAIGGDEGIYADQAASFLHGQITPYTYTYDHPFFGWAQISPLAWIAQQLHIAGPLSVVNTRAVMVLYAFASLMLVYGILRRLDTHRVIAVGGTLALGLSPLYVEEARQVYLDSIALVWVLLAFWLALNPKQKQWTYALAGVSFGIGVLSKETVLLVLPALILIVWTKCYRPIRLMSIAAFVALGTLTVLAYPLFALLRNELFPGAGHVSLWQNGIMYQLANRKGSGALWQHHSGRYDLVQSWLNYDHWLLYVGAVCALACLASPRFRAIGLAFVLWSLPIVKPGGYMPAMYVIVGLPFAAMSIAGCADLVSKFVLARLAPRRWLAWGALAAVWVTIGALLLAVIPPKKADITSAAIRPQEQAVAFLKPLLHKQDNVLTDPAFWLDLVRDGHGSVTDPWHGAISYYQFDLDPISSTKNLPQGWRNIDYVLASPAMLAVNPADPLPKLTQTLAHSTVLAKYGSGDSEVEVLAVRPTPYNHHLTLGN